SGQVYTLLNCKSGTALGLSGLDSRSIVGSIPRGLDEQWKLEQPRGSGMAWRFRSMGSGKYLDFEDDAREGTRVIGSRVPRNWKMRRDEACPSTFRIYVPKMSLNVELVNGDGSPGAAITLEGYTPDKSQVWRF
ncbi:carbohydrate-binding module family 13 protein, partial [Amylostereum chailletii]